ncbi:MAG: hypothetical protein O7I93_16105 [Gemmatimonadetes bacterium]|nr:hypothetical protein [Gemmatimonadota bacterium]
MSNDDGSPAGAPTHPVQALGDILEKIWTASRKGSDSARNTLAAAFDVDPKRPELVLHEFARLMELSLHARHTIEKAAQGKNLRKMYLRPLNRLDRLLGDLDLSSGNSGITEALQEVMPNLKYAEDMVDRQLALKPEDEELLMAILNSCQELIAEIVNSDLPGELIKILVSRLNAVREAALNYRVYGDEFLRSALDHAFGTLITTHADVEPSKWEGIRTQVYSVLTKGYKLIKFGEDIARLAGLATDELSGGELPTSLPE